MKSRSGNILKITDRNDTHGMFFQAGILAGAGILVRIIGLLYRAPLTAVIGDEGNGYYGFAYNIYTIVLLISSYSIPSALSKVMAQKLALGQARNAQRVFRCALLYAAAVGTAAGLFLFFGARRLVPEAAVSVLRIFAPTVFVFGILGVLRGYFQAYGSMVQTSISQILEQLVNAVMSIAAAYALMWVVAGKDLTTRSRFGAMGSALGTGSGVLIALLFVAWCFYLDKPERLARIREDLSQPDDYGPIFKETILAITPFILSGFILNLTTSLNQTVYYYRMAADASLSEAYISTQYGIFSNKAVVITNIPISIATAVAAATIPGISASFARREMEVSRHHAAEVTRVTMLIAMPCAAGLVALAWPATYLLFPQQASLDTAAQLLALLAITVVFYSMATVSNAVLQAIGKMQMPLVSAGIALVIQTIVLKILLDKTDWGVYTLVFVSVVYSVLICLMNSFFINRYLDLKLDLVRVYIKPFAAASVMGFAAVAVYAVFFLLFGLFIKKEYWVNLIAILPAFCAAVLCYAYLMIRFGAIGKKDILDLPGGRTLCAVLERIRFL